MKKHKAKKYEKIKRVFWFFTGKRYETGEYIIEDIDNRRYIVPISYKREGLWLVKKLDRKRRHALNHHEYML